MDRLTTTTRWLAPAALVLTSLTSTPVYAQAYDDPETERLMCKFDGSCPKDEAAPEATPSPGTPTPSPEVAVIRPRPRGLALKRAEWVVTITTEASVGRDAMLAPTSIAPDVSYGLTDRLTLSLVHSGFATTGFRGSSGGGLCLSGEDRGCTQAYNNVGAEALVDLVRGRVAVAAVAGLHAISFDPMFVDAKVGVQTAYQTKRITATLSPSVFLGLTERDRGNEGTVFVPASFGVQVSRRWFVATGGGIATPLADAGGGWTARLGAIARYRVRRGVFVAGSLFLPKLAGGSAVDATGVDARVANLWLTYSP